MGAAVAARLVSPHRVFPGNLVAFDVDVELCGDVTLRMSHIEFPLFRLQFHTAFVKVEVGMIEFSLAELDEENEQPQVFARRFNPATKLRFFVNE